MRARKRFAAGVGVTTIEQRVLPFVPIDVQIPARVGTAAPPSYRSIAEPACLGSPLTEKPIGAGQPIDMYTLREWHTDRAALVSIDGLFFVRSKAAQTMVRQAGKPHAGRVLFLQSRNCGLDLLANGRRGADLRGGMVDARVA